MRTRGDGHWKKYTYQDSTFTLTLSGLLKFDSDSWTGWDMIDNQLTFSHVLVRCSFNDENGDIRTMQGYVMIETSTVGYSPGALVKTDFQLQGNGKLDLFDGLVPCPSIITSVTVTGQTAMDGIAHIDYTYTGDVYQVKYRIDATGDYVYAVADITIDVPGLSVGDHLVEIIPVCINGYEGTGLIEDFTITQSLTCSSAITAITVTTGSGANATNTYTGAATQMKYRIDGGVWINTLITTIVSLAGMSVGNHTIEEVPICANGAEGTGLVQPFTVASQPAQSIIQYAYTGPTNNSALKIYSNGVLIVNVNSTQSGFRTVATGSSIKGVITTNGPHTVEIKTEDITTSTTLDDQTDAGPITLQYIFTANGDTFKITGTSN